MDLMESYNAESLAKKEQYSAQVHMRGNLFEELVWWALQALPDEILVGLDVDSKSANRLDVETKYRRFSHRSNLFQGQGYIINEARIVNRGDSYSVHHLPEEWTDGLFSGERGSRAGRFTHWLHTHPNAPAIPSNADADAAQDTNGIDTAYVNTGNIFQVKKDTLFKRIINFNQTSYNESYTDYISRKYKLKNETKNTHGDTTNNTTGDHNVDG